MECGKTDCLHNKVCNEWKLLGNDNYINDSYGNCDFYERGDVSFMEMRSNGIECCCIPDNAKCKLAGKNPLDMEECPDNHDYCDGDCFYYTEDEMERDIAALIAEDNVTMSDASFKEGILKKYYLELDVGALYNRKPFRKVWVYHLSTRGDKSSLYEYEGFAAYDDFTAQTGEIIRSVVIYARKKGGVKQITSLKTDSLEMFYKNEGVEIFNYIYSLDRKTEDEVKTMFDKVRDEKIQAIKERYCTEGLTMEFVDTPHKIIKCG